MLKQVITFFSINMSTWKTKTYFEGSMWRSVLHNSEECSKMHNRFWPAVNVSIFPEETRCHTWSFLVSDGLFIFHKKEITLALQMEHAKAVLV